MKVEEHLEKVGLIILLKFQGYCLETLTPKGRLRILQVFWYFDCFHTEAELEGWRGVGFELICRYFSGWLINL